LILQERDANGSFADFYDFCQRVHPSVLNKRSIESLIKAGAFDCLGHSRKGLCLVFELIVDRVLARRREVDAGVLSLFGDMDASEVGFDDTRVPIPDDEFDKSVRLSFEKEMLGLYISDHPLLGAEFAVRRHAERTIAELRELRDGETHWVGGVITSLQRKYTKRGELMAVFVLEDLQSAIEVFVFPRAMQEHGFNLSDDAVICVKGRLDLREEPAKLVCMDLRRIEVDDGPIPALRLALPLAGLRQSLVDDLKRVLLEHPGESPVLLQLGEKVLRLPDQFRVDGRNGLLAELRVLLGPSGILL
jgi:DNA polymerase-3 subunit alpha